jgi:glutathione peroxidase
MRQLSIFLIIYITATMASASSLYDIPLTTIDGETTSLEQYKGKVLLIVNVASKCGFTKQYAGLEELYKEKKDEGFVVLGFPCNDFGNQEPGTNEEIMEFCSMNFGVTFPMFDKLHVKGKDQHPLYAALTGKDSPFPGSIKWNFGKFLIDRNGNIVDRFGSMTGPGSSKLRKAVESALGAQ